MSKQRPLGCLISSTITASVGIVLVVAASISIEDTNYARQFWKQIFGLSVFSIIIATFAFLFAGFLIYVALRQFPALTTLFSGLLVFTSVLAAICGIIFVTNRADLRITTFNNTANMIRNYSSSNSARNSNSAVGLMQRTFQCCGIEMATDWKSSFSDGASTPDSCCVKVVRGCGTNALNKQDNIYLRGCAEPVYFRFRYTYNLLLGLNFALMGLGLISAIFGIIYANYVRQQYELM